MAIKYLAGKRIEGLTADTKPPNAEEGSIYKDIQTGDEFRMESGVWVPKPSGGANNLDQLTDVDTTTDTPDNNDVLTWNGTNWVPAAPPGAGGGEANTLGSVGTGEGTLPGTKVGTTLNVKSLKQGTNVTLTNNTSDVTINSAYPPDANNTTKGIVELSESDGSENTGGKAVQDNDTRLTNSRTPTAHASSHLSNGTDPIPVATGAVRGTVALASDGGTTASTVVQATDSRLSNARTPTAHASTHSSGQSDPITIGNLAGTLGVTKGGTGKTSITQHSLLKGGAGNTIDEVAAGTEGHVLKVVSGTPAWAAESTGGGSFTRENFEYLVYHNGTAYVALNGATGSLHATTSTTDAAAVINAAINDLTNGGKIYLGVGTFLMRTKINAKTKIHIQGSGEGTIIKQDATQNLAAIIEGDSFTTLTGGGTNGGPHSVYLSDFAIEGNKANNTSTATDGIRYYGFNWHIKNVHIRDCKGRGMYSEWDDDPLAPNLTTSMESYYSHIRIHDCDGDGWLNRGPHDWEGEHILIYDNGGHGYVQEYSAGLYDGGGFVDTMHMYANDGLYGAWIKGGTLHANRLTTESCANSASGVGGIGTYVNGGGLDCNDLWTFGQDKGIVFGSGTSCQVSGLRSHNNKVSGMELLMNDVKIDGKILNNSNAGAGKGIILGSGGASVSNIRLNLMISGSPTALIDWANSGNQGIDLKASLYTDSTNSVAILNESNINTNKNSIQLEHIANGTSVKKIHYLPVSQGQVITTNNYKRTGQFTVGHNSVDLSGLLVGATMQGTVSYGFDGWEGRTASYPTTTTANSRAGLNGGGSAMLPICTRRMDPYFWQRHKISDNSSARYYSGFSTLTAMPASDTPLGSSDKGVLVGYRSTGDSNYKIFYNDGTAAAPTPIDTGLAVNGNWITIEILADEANGRFSVYVSNGVSTYSTILTTRIPGSGDSLVNYAVIENTTTSARTVQFGSSIILKTNFIP